MGGIVRRRLYWGKELQWLPARQSRARAARDFFDCSRPLVVNMSWEKNGFGLIGRYHALEGPLVADAPRHIFHRCSLTYLSTQGRTPRIKFPPQFCSH